MTTVRTIFGQMEYCNRTLVIDNFPCSVLGFDHAFI
jgi:hypothetical protein